MVWLLLDLPPEETLTPIAKEYFKKYGAVAVFAAAVLEGLFVIGWYFPGSTIIVVCLIVAADDPLSFLTAAISAAVGLSAAYFINFVLGKHGWYRLLTRFGFGETIETAKKRLAQHGLTAIFLSYWQFGLASTTSTAAGILRFHTIRFGLISSAGAFFWSAFYSTLIFVLGPAAMQLVGLKLLIGLAVVWILVAASREVISRRRIPDA